MEIKPVREMALGLTETWSGASLRFLIPSMKEKKNQQIRYVTPKTMIPNNSPVKEFVDTLSRSGKNERKKFS